MSFEFSLHIPLQAQRGFLPINSVVIFVKRRINPNLTGGEGGVGGENFLVGAIVRILFLYVIKTSLRQLKIKKKCWSFLGDGIQGRNKKIQRWGGGRGDWSKNS